MSKQRENAKHRSKAYTLALMGMMFALAMVFSFVEGMLPAAPMLPPGVKLGLSNIVTMYALLFLGVKEGYTIAVLKSLFVLLVRGPIGAALSLAGGLASITVMVLKATVASLRQSKSLLSIAGAVFHNLGQLLMSVVIIGNAWAFSYLPVMLLSGVGMGLVTGIMLRLIAPYLTRLNIGLNKNLYS